MAGLACVELRTILTSKVNLRMVQGVFARVVAPCRWDPKFPAQ